ncbi:MAG TPA: RDD family protein [Acidimicrobiales bacterium]|nr:RDD family protein [Acidimicrobiales bacterium]
MSAEEPGSEGEGTGGGPPAFPGNAPPPAPAPPAEPSSAGPSSAGPSSTGSTAAQGLPAFPAQTRAPGGYPAPPPPQYDDTPQYASWGIRVGGYLIDFVIFAIVLVVLILLFRHTHGLEVHLMAKKGGRRRSFTAVPFVLTAVLYVVYGTVLCGSARGQTVGMMAVGVRAVRDESFAVLGYGRALARALVEGIFRLLSLLSFFLGIIWLLDMLWPLWDGKRQTLHDKCAGSVVLRIRAAPG